MPKIKFDNGVMMTLDREPSSQEIEELGKIAMSRGRSPINQQLKSVFPEIPAGEQVKHPYLTATAETAQDILTIPAHFANQFLLDYPRRVTEHFGYEYPSGNKPDENILGLMKRKPVSGTLAGIAGVAGGIKNPLFKMLGGGIGAGLGRNVLAGGATGLAYSPSKFESPQQVAGEQITKAVGGMLLPIAGKAISKAGPAIAGLEKAIISKGAGLSKTAIDTVRRLGFQKVRGIANKGINYIQEDVIPRARQSLIKNITSAGEASKELLQDMGFNPDQINDVMKISKQNMNKYGKLISESWVKTEKNLGEALTNVGKQIGNVYTNATKEGRKINIKNTIGSMRKQLKGMGVVDESGNLLGDYKTHPSSAVKNLAQIYSEYAPRIGRGDIPVSDFLNLRTRLQASIVRFAEGEKFNVPIYKVNKVLKEDSINSLFQKGSPYEKIWRNLNKEYSDLITLDDLTKKITTVANSLPNKILTQRNKLTEKHLKLYGRDIVNDVDAYNAARELYPEKETIGLFNLQKPVIRGAFKGTEMAKEAARPLTAPLGQGIRQSGQFVGKTLKQIMDEPSFSPQAKRDFFGKASSKSGQAFKGILGPTMATGAGLAAALKATTARGETGEALDPKYKQQIANAENYGKTTGDWAQIEDIVIRDLKRIGKLKQNITLEQVKKDPQLYDKVVKLYWDRLDAFGIPEKDKALWWLMPSRYRQTGGDISMLKNPEHRNIMQNRVKNIGGRK